jgi:hypothetical protein
MKVEVRGVDGAGAQIVAENRPRLKSAKSNQNVFLRQNVDLTFT